MTDAGEFTTRVYHLRPVRTPDGQGGFVTSWGRYRRLWAKMTTQRGAETFAQRSTQNVTRIFLEFRNFNDVQDIDAFEVDGEIWNVETPYRKGARDLHAKVLCTRGDPA